MFFLVSNIIVVAIILFLLYVLSAVWPPDSPWAPWWQMPEDVCLEAARLANVGKNDVIYDLGCGTGKALLIANTKFGAKGVGIEIDPLRVLLAKWNVWKRKAREVQVLKKNFFDVDISDATVVYMYLVPKAIGRLKPKFMKELKPGVKLVSYIYDLPETYKGKVRLLKHDTKSNLFIYKLL